MLKRMWNSKFMDIFSEVTIGVLQTLGETLLEVFDNSIEHEDEETPTYDYWMSLSYEEQKEYFENNEYLNIYDEFYYPTDRELTSKHMQELANKYGREFTNKYDRY